VPPAHGVPTIDKQFLNLPLSNSSTGLQFAENNAINLVLRDYRVNTEVRVEATDASASVPEGFQQTITPREIETSAGTFGDPERFLQTLAGIVNDNDQRNDFLVRGGNPGENLFVIDNIDVPSINQLALSDTTGGFASMIDPDVVQKVVIHTDAYDDKFDQRLSSIVEFSTRPEAPVGYHAATELGIGGAGGSITRPLGREGSLFVSARQGVLQYLTNDIGMNGVPHYRNAFFRAEAKAGEHDQWWGMSLTGIDSLLIHPDIRDKSETSPYDISYKGWRNTAGINWQHTFSPTSFGVASLAHSIQSQAVVDNAQRLKGATVYNENTSDRISTFKYDWEYQPSHLLVISAGGRAAVDELNYNVAQALGLQDPYSNDPKPVNATAMLRRFATTSSAAYAQATLSLSHSIQLSAGMRSEQWALGGHHADTARALLSAPLFGRLVHLGYTEYAQIPPALYLLSYNNLQSLRPIRAQHWTGGITLVDDRHIRATLEAYQKRYLDYPVSAAHPELSMANIADTFGTAFLMFPMTAAGKGIARGAELTVAAHLDARTSVTVTATYSRSWYSGLDGVLRRGNFDKPIVVNLLGNRKLNHSMQFSWRYTVTSGTPYTPDNMALSYAQNRDVYSLNQINSLRSSAYSRLDFRLEQTLKLGQRTMLWHAGLQNAFDNQNFYCYLWKPTLGGVSEQTQMPIFPDAGLKFSF
jgi:hypothetical protein